MKRTILAAALLAAFAMPALAADPQPAASSGPVADPRVQAATIDALQALLRLRETQILASTADAQARLAALIEKCGDRCAEPAPQAKTEPPAAAPSTPEAPKPKR